MVIENAKMLWYDVMMLCTCMHKQVSVYTGKQYSHKAHKALGLGLHEVQVLPSFSLLVKTCPIKSNRVLEDLKSLATLNRS